MSESLRDRVARVLCDSMDDDGPKGPVCPGCEGQADALIAAGLVLDLNEAGSEFGNDRLDGTVMTARDYRKSEAIALHEARGMVAVTRRIYATDWEPIEATS